MGYFIYDKNKEEMSTFFDFKFPIEQVLVFQHDKIFVFIFSTLILNVNPRTLYTEMSHTTEYYRTTDLWLRKDRVSRLRPLVE